jgi:hypothetical protein
VRNNALHQTAIPLRFLTADELEHYGYNHKTNQIHVLSCGQGDEAPNISSLFADPIFTHVSETGALLTNVVISVSYLR